MSANNFSRCQYTIQLDPQLIMNIRTFVFLIDLLVLVAIFYHFNAKFLSVGSGSCPFNAVALYFYV